MKLFCLRAAASIAIGMLLAAPWVRGQLVWCGWLGVAVALALVHTLRGWTGLLWACAPVALAIAAAFAWSPAAFAYTMDSSYALGVLVFLPFLLWDTLRCVLPVWFASRIAGSANSTWFLAAMASVVVEAITPSIFPWRLGYFQLAWPWTLQAVDVFGPGWSTVMAFAHGGAILFIVRSCYALAARTPPWRPTIFTAMPLLFCAANAAYSAAAMSYWSRQIEAATSIKVALVQADPGFRSSIEDLRRLTKPVAADVDLVCWPESSGGSYSSLLKEFSDVTELLALSRAPEIGLRPWPEPNCALLFGARTYVGNRDRPSAVYQTAYLVDDHERILGQYRKRELMPFGEYVPAASWLPALDTLFNMTETFARGDEPTVLPGPVGSKLGVMMCYEDMNPAAARELVSNSANLLVSLVNASAFPETVTLEQHRLLAQQRAIECRRYFLRCTATGETCVISPLGTIESRLPFGTKEVLKTRVALLDRVTLQSHLARAFPILAAVLLTAFCVWRWRVEGGQHSADRAPPQTA